jgi:hypothetical protein
MASRAGLACEITINLDFGMEIADLKSKFQNLPALPAGRQAVGKVPNPKLLEP